MKMDMIALSTTIFPFDTTSTDGMVCLFYGETALMLCIFPALTFCLEEALQPVPGGGPQLLVEGGVGLDRGYSDDIHTELGATAA